MASYDISILNQTQYAFFFLWDKTKFTKPKLQTESTKQIFRNVNPQKYQTKSIQSKQFCQSKWGETKSAEN